MMTHSVAIVKSDFHENHSGSWGNEWINLCRELNLNHEVVDWRKFGAFDILKRCDLVLWHFSHYSADEMKFARPILTALRAGGTRVFPDLPDSLHFDDKIAQAYLLDALGIPTPKNQVFHSLSSLNEWSLREGKYPIVAKLRTGSGSANVVLIRSERELKNYGAKMFGAGLSGRPNTLLKVSSNLASAANWSEVIKRAKRAPEFLFTWQQASKLPRESGYVYLQDFISDVVNDLKVVVVGDRLSFIGRHVRSGDFRASGGGSLFYDRDLVTPQVIQVAFDAAEKLGSDCTGLDIVVNPKDGQPLVLEVSYGFSHSALMQAQGYFDRAGRWHDKPLNAPRYLLEKLIGTLG